jgi:hypothetical protein
VAQCNCNGHGILGLSPARRRSFLYLRWQPRQTIPGRLKWTPPRPRARSAIPPILPQNTVRHMDSLRWRLPLPMNEQISRRGPATPTRRRGGARGDANDAGNAWRPDTSSLDVACRSRTACPRRYGRVLPGGQLLGFSASWPKTALRSVTGPQWFVPQGPRRAPHTGSMRSVLHTPLGHMQVIGASQDPGHLLLAESMQSHSPTVSHRTEGKTHRGRCLMIGRVE